MRKPAVERRLGSALRRLVNEQIVELWVGGYDFDLLLQGQHVHIKPRKTIATSGRRKLADQLYPPKKMSVPFGKLGQTNCFFKVVRQARVVRFQNINDHGTLLSIPHRD
jgi:hypothetical protein